LAAQGPHQKIRIFDEIFLRFFKHYSLDCPIASTGAGKYFKKCAGAASVTGGLRALPEGIGRLAYLPWAGLKKLVAQQAVDRAAEGPVRADGAGGAPPAGCTLTTLPEGIGALAGYM
jgi:hypothetical protein